MFSYNQIVQLASDAFSSVATQHEFQLNLCHTVLTMVEQGRLMLNLQVAPYFVTKTDEESAISTSTSPLPSLPPSLYYMPEHKKARLRATYTRTKQIYRPDSAHLSREQRTGPVKLSGPNAATNVALWPSAMQVNLGHDYKGGESSTALSPGQAANCVNSMSDVTVRGAIEVLNALVRGVDEDWLEAPGVVKDSQIVVAPAMERSSTQEGKRPSTSNSLAPHMARSHVQSGPQTRGGVAKVACQTAPRLARSYGQIGFPTPTHAIREHVTYSAARPMTRSYTKSGPSFFIYDSPIMDSAGTTPLDTNFEYSSRDSPCPARSYKETYEAAPHNEDRLRATFDRVQRIYRPGSCVRPFGQRPGSNAELLLHGTDAALNVALYPRAMLVRLNTDEEEKIRNVQSTVYDPIETVEGAIERLQPIVDGIGYDWVGTDRPDEVQHVVTLAQLSPPASSSTSSGSSMRSGSSIISGSTASSSVATPLEQAFPFNLVDENGKF